MKKLMFLTLILLCGCAATAPDGGPSGTPETTPSNGQSQLQTADPASGGGSVTEPQGYLFEAYGQDIYVCAEAAPVLSGLPEPRDIFESPSCAFEGMDITYFYPGFELTTYPENGREHVLSVVFTDDGVTTPEGVYLGGALADMEKAYGGGYERSGGQYTYTRGAGSLIFTIEDDIIAGIMYTMIIGG